MARKKFFDDLDDQQENHGIKGFQNKKNHLGSSPPRSGVLGMVHRGRANQKLNHHPNHNGLPAAVTAEESLYSVVKQLSNDGLTIREMPGDGYAVCTVLNLNARSLTTHYTMSLKAKE